jgi:OOP family OmpA-OmpF porin
LSAQALVSSGAVRGLVLAVGILASVTAVADAEPRIDASVFAGVDWFGRAELGNSRAPDQVPGTSPIVGVRASWLAAPALPAGLELALEGELALAPAFTGDSASEGRTAYFAPVFAWRAHGLVRLTRWRSATPHVVLGGGGQTIASSSPFMTRDTDPIGYWGPGVRVPVLGSWHLRIDARHGVVPARNGGATSTFEAELGIGTTFGQPAPQAPPVPPVAAPPPPPPIDTDRDGDGVPDRVDGCPTEPESVNNVADADGCPEPDPDADSVLDAADRCPDQPEDVDGFEDADGCPEPDNDGDAIEDGRDACPAEAEAINSFEDDDGCPDLLPAEITAALATTIRFEPGRARVTPAAASALAPVLAMLQNHSAVRLAIVGHPDRAGGEDLARRRADAVKWHLVDQGVVEDRITTRVGAIASSAVDFQLVRTAP